MEDLERDLVELLDYDQFALVKELTQNRLTIVWCSRLARSENADEEKRIEVRRAPYFRRRRGAPMCSKLQTLVTVEKQRFHARRTLNFFKTARCSCALRFCSMLVVSENSYIDVLHSGALQADVSQSSPVCSLLLS